MSAFSETTDENSCLGVVLAGGLSCRRGQDKARFIRNNCIMLQFSKQLFHGVGLRKVVVSGNDYEVPDLFEKLGPVAAIYSVIKQCKASALLIMPVDLPLLDVDTLIELKIQGHQNSKACCYQDNWLPLYLPITQSLLDYLEQALTSAMQQQNGKGPSMRAMLQRTNNMVLTAKTPIRLLSANTPEQWQQLAKNSFNGRNKYV